MFMDETLRTLQILWTLKSDIRTRSYIQALQFIRNYFSPRSETQRRHCTKRLFGRLVTFRLHVPCNSIVESWINLHFNLEWVVNVVIFWLFCQRATLIKIDNLALCHDNHKNSRLRNNIFPLHNNQEYKSRYFWFSNLLLSNDSGRF